MATAVYMEEQGRLVGWLKNEGDEVRRGDILAEVETDKATLELVARESGVLRKRLISAGDSRDAGTMIAIIAAPGEDLSALTGAAGAAPPQAPAPFAAEAPPVREVEPAAAGHAGNGTPAAGDAREELAERATATETAPAAAPPPAAGVMRPPAGDGTGAGDGRVHAPPPPVPPREPVAPAAGERRTFDGVPGLRAAAEQRSEFVDGRAVAPGASSLAHNLIVSNVVGTLFSALRGTGCRVVSQGMPVKPARGENVFFPDVGVFCGAAELEPGAVEMLLNPGVLVEVLSPGTTDFDHGKKWESYRRIASLRDYLLVWHDQARVEWYTRQGAFWLFGEVEGLQAEMRLESIGVTLRLAEIYEGVLAADAQSA